MLDILIRQLAWPEDTEWEAPGNEDELDEDIAAFKNFRGVGFGKLAICLELSLGLQHADEHVCSPADHSSSLSLKSTSLFTRKLSQEL